MEEGLAAARVNNVGMFSTGGDGLHAVRVLGRSRTGLGRVRASFPIVLNEEFLMLDGYGFTAAVFIPSGSYAADVYVVTADDDPSYMLVFRASKKLPPWPGDDIPLLT